ASEQLWVVNADGTDLRLLAQNLKQNSYVAGEFSWAPNGKRIVFAGWDGLFTVTTQGIPTVRRIIYPQISHFPVALQPTWCPDGSRIAFSDLAPFKGPVPNSIVVMTANGNQVHVLHHGHDPVWSPNGRRIAGRTSPPGGCCSGYLLTMR